VRRGKRKRKAMGEESWGLMRREWGYVAFACVF
jgi:hypothetical protein